MDSTPPPANIDTPSPALVSALRRLLKPLIRLLLERGIGYPYLAELLKGLFVEVTEESFQLPGKRQTDSHVSLVTGLHRKDVKRLRTAPDDITQSTKPPPLSAQLIASWIGNRRYNDDQGAPIPLARLAAANAERSFEGLVTSISTDIRPRAILDEWLRQGIVRLDDNDHVHLLTEAFIPKAGQEEKIYYFGRNLHDHIAAGVHNLLGAQPPMLERNVYYDRLTPASVAALARLSRDQGMHALHAINRAALDLQEQDTGKPEARQRMSFGTYFYTPAGDKPETNND